MQIKKQDLSSQKNTELNEAVQYKQAKLTLPSPASKSVDNLQEDNFSRVERDGFSCEQLCFSPVSEATSDFDAKSPPSGPERYFEDSINKFNFPKNHPTDQPLEEDIPSPSGFIASSCHLPQSSSSNSAFSSCTSLSHKNKKSCASAECQVDLVNFTVVNNVLYIAPGPDAKANSTFPHSQEIKTSYPESNPESMDLVFPQSLNFLNRDQISGWEIFKPMLHRVLRPYKWLLSKSQILCLLFLLPYCRGNFKSMIKEKNVIF